MSENNDKKRKITEEDNDSNRKARILREIENEEITESVNQQMVEYIMVKLYRVLIMYISNQSWDENKLIEEFKATIPDLKKIKECSMKELQDFWVDMTEEFKGDD